MNNEEIKNFIQQTKAKEKRQDLLSKIIEVFPNITIKECMDLGFSYEEIIFG